MPGHFEPRILVMMKCIAEGLRSEENIQVYVFEYENNLRVLVVLFTGALR